VLVEPFRGIVDDMNARKLPLQMTGENLVDLDGEIKCGGGNFFLNRAREGAGAGTKFDHDFGLFQSDIGHHAFRQPRGTRHDGAGQRRGAQKHLKKFCVFVNHPSNCFP